MIDLNNEKTRQQLVRQYLNAETTLEEERLLADILSDSDTALSTEEEDVLLLLQASRLIGQTDVTTEKADEFDRLMHKGRNKKGRLVTIRWVAPVAAAIVCALLLFPTVHTDRTKEKQEVAMAAPAQTVVKPRQDTADADANKPALLAEKKAPRHKRSKTVMERQSRTETPEVNDISTSELLETVRLLSDMGTDDIIITASSSNDGFIIKTTDSNGPTTAYMLRRCADGTSIELTSQITNF
ncbi:MAG: hypothetical protein IJT90_09075 [Bacteroidaceae bacterium]|nr:hypothetical protein [Bacteroidaceae bacterium]